MKVIVEVRRVFGKDLIYPVSPSAFVLADIVGSAWLSERECALAMRLGIEVEFVPNKAAREAQLRVEKLSVDTGGPL